MNRQTTALLFSTCAILWAAGAIAEGGPGCDLHIGAVVASNVANSAEQPLDKRLIRIRKPLHSLLPYSSYKLIKEESRHVAWGGRESFDLPGGRYLLVVPKGFKDGRVSLKVLLIEGSRPLLDTVLALRNRGTFLVAGPRHQEGVLIISIGAKGTM